MLAFAIVVVFVRTPPPPPPPEGENPPLIPAEPPPPTIRYSMFVFPFGTNVPLVVKVWTVCAQSVVITPPIANPFPSKTSKSLADIPSFSSITVGFQFVVSAFGNVSKFIPVRFLYKTPL